MVMMAVHGARTGTGALSAIKLLADGGITTCALSTATATTTATTATPTPTPTPTPTSSQSCAAAKLNSKLNFEHLTRGKTLGQVSSIFNEAFAQKDMFASPAARHAVLMQMRSEYCRKMLEECAIPEAALARLRDPTYLPSHAEVTEAFRLTLPQPATSQRSESSRVAANIEANMELMSSIVAKPMAARTFQDNYVLEFGPMTFSALFSFCEVNGIFEVLTHEYGE